MTLLDLGLRLLMPETGTVGVPGRVVVGARFRAVAKRSEARRGGAGRARAPPAQFPIRPHGGAGAAIR